MYPYVSVRISYVMLLLFSLTHSLYFSLSFVQSNSNSLSLSNFPSPFIFRVNVFWTLSLVLSIYFVFLFVPRSLLISLPLLPSSLLSFPPSPSLFSPGTAVGVEYYWVKRSLELGKLSVRGSPRGTVDFSLSNNIQRENNMQRRKYLHIIMKK